jgi:hypothetical protein
MALTAEELAREMEPQAKEELERHRGDFLRRAGSFLKRQAVNLLWPTITALLPAGLAWAFDVILLKFGKMTVSDLITAVVLHNKSKGQMVHPSYFQAGLPADPSLLGVKMEYDTNEHAGLVDEIAAQAEEHLASSAALQPGTYGAAPPAAAVYGGPLRDMSMSLVAILVREGASLVYSNRQEIIDFISKEVARATAAVLERAKSLGS